MTVSDMDKQKTAEKQQIILDLLREFCAKKLDEEYFELAERLTQKLGRKRNVPFITGKPEIWAAAIIHALGTINFQPRKCKTVIRSQIL